MSTCDRLDLQTLGSQPIMHKNLPDHCKGPGRLGSSNKILTCLIMPRNPPRTLGQDGYPSTGVRELPWAEGERTLPARAGARVRRTTGEDRQGHGPWTVKDSLSLPGGQLPVGDRTGNSCFIWPPVLLATVTAVKAGQARSPNSCVSGHAGGDLMVVTALLPCSNNYDCGCSSEK